VLVLLPPSEGKASGGTGPPLDLEALSFPALTPVRHTLLSTVERLAREQPDELRLALGLSERQADVVATNGLLTTSPTRRAAARYTGVLFEALGYRTLSSAGRRRANGSLLVSSALFGLVRPTDRIPSYRLSGSTVLPGLGGLARLWRPVLEPELRDMGGLVIDLRSGTYAALARVPRAVAVRVLRETGGRRTVVSHDNKYTKGRLARALCESGARTVAEVAEAGRSVADVVEVDGRRVDLVLHGLATARPGQTVSG
jgi:cytoplasmic iron level regulating protein YaaA (DUF328/UPF0246 family)